LKRRVFTRLLIAWFGAASLYIVVNALPSDWKREIVDGSVVAFVEASCFPCQELIKTGGPGLGRVGCGHMWLYEREFVKDRGSALVWFGPVVLVGMEVFAMLAVLVSLGRGLVRSVDGQSREPKP